MADHRSSTEPTDRESLVKVVIVVDYFFPGHRGGGVPHAVLELIRRVPTAQFDIVTTDKDQGDPVPYPVDRRWGPAPWGRVHYLTERQQRPFSCWATIRSLGPDVVLFTSTFSRPTVGSLVARRVKGRNQPVVIWSQGELGPEALAQKRAKKDVYLRLARMARLFQGVFWCCADAEELAAATALSSTGAAEHHPVSVPKPPKPGPARSKRFGSVCLVYAGRIVERKGLLLLLDALHAVTGDVRVNVIGSPEDEDYVRACRERADALPSNCQVRFLGPLPHDEVMQELSSADGSVLLSEFESFGYAVYEALAVGCVPLISAHTAFDFPDGAGGFIVDRDRDAVRAAVQEFVDMDDDAYRQRSNDCRALAVDLWRNDRHAESLVEHLRAVAVRATRSTTRTTSGPTSSSE
ncbi:MAG: glycosyltransferase [Aquihabitans sp.]